MHILSLALRMQGPGVCIFKEGPQGMRDPPPQESPGKSTGSVALTGSLADRLVGLWCRRKRKKGILKRVRGTEGEGPFTAVCP